MMGAQFYRIEMGDPAVPMGCNTRKSYFGWLPDIYNAIRQMDADEVNLDTVRAFDEFMNGNSDVSHVVCGSEIALLTPMDMIAKERMTLLNHEWVYEDNFGFVRRLRADKIIVEQVLLRDTCHYFRCMRPHFVGLKMRGAEDEIWRKAFLSNDNLSMLMIGAGTISLIPYVLEQETEIAADAMGAMWREEMLDFTAACSELFGRV